MERSFKEFEQRPTLVYKRKFSVSDITYMDEMVKLGKRVLIVVREENSPKQKIASGLLKDELIHIGAIEAKASNFNPQVTKVYFKIIGQDTALNQITPSADPYVYFDYLFVNASSSRQVSLMAVLGNTETKVKVITIHHELNSTSHQVAGRFRENRVDIIHYLKGYKKDDIPLFSGLALWKNLLNIDLLIRLYMEHDNVIKRDGSISWPIMKKQLLSKPEWIPKTMIGKANQKSKHRLNVFNSWFKSESNLNQTQLKLLASYRSYCKGLSEKPYSKNIFASKLKEAKNKHP